MADLGWLADSLHLFRMLPKRTYIKPSIADRGTGLSEHGHATSVCTLWRSLLKH